MTRMAIAVLAAAGALLASVGLLATSAWLVARAAQHPPVLSLMVAIVGVRAFGLARGVLRYAERVVGHDAALRALARSRARVFDRLADLAPAGLRPDPGARLELVVSAVDGIADRWLRGLIPMIAAGAAGVAAVGLEWRLAPSAGLILAVTLVAGGVGAPLVARSLAVSAVRREAASRVGLASLVAETLQGWDELTAHGAMPAVAERAEVLEARVARSTATSAWTAGLGSAISMVSCGAAVVGALAVGVEARLGMIPLAVVTLLPLAAFEPALAMSSAAQQLLRSREDAARLRSVLEAPDPVQEPATPIPASRKPASPSSGPGVRVEGATAQWPGGRRVVLPDLYVPPGGRLALLGPSGAGKSTLAAVLLRFVEYEGSVTLGGQELRDMPGDVVRSMIGLCAQDAHLFDTTVAENIRLARPDAADTEIRDVLARVGLSGLDPATRVGEHGRAVSGGEHRRITLARALLAGTPVLVLDEPDAHLDEAAADAVLHDLLAAAGERSVLLITHRAGFPGDHPMLRAMDEVITLEGCEAVLR